MICAVEASQWRDAVARVRGPRAGYVGPAAPSYREGGRVSTVPRPRRHCRRGRRGPERTLRGLWSPPRHGLRPREPAAVTSRPCSRAAGSARRARAASRRRDLAVALSWPVPRAGEAGHRPGPARPRPRRRGAPGRATRRRRLRARQRPSSECAATLGPAAGAPMSARRGGGRAALRRTARGVPADAPVVSGSHDVEGRPRGGGPRAPRPRHAEAQLDRCAGVSRGHPVCDRGCSERPLERLREIGGCWVSALRARPSAARREGPCSSRLRRRDLVESAVASRRAPGGLSHPVLEAERTRSATSCRCHRGRPSRIAASVAAGRLVREAAIGLASAGRDRHRWPSLLPTSARVGRLPARRRHRRRGRARGLYVIRRASARAARDARCRARLQAPQRRGACSACSDGVRGASGAPLARGPRRALSPVPARGVVRWHLERAWAARSATRRPRRIDVVGPPERSASARAGGPDRTDGLPVQDPQPLRELATLTRTASSSATHPPWRSSAAPPPGARTAAVSVPLPAK